MNNDIKTMIIAILLAQLIKDPFNNFCIGFKIFLSKTYSEEDHVLINGEEAIIEKIGIMKTKFRFIKRNTYFYVWNDRFKFLKLEKIINEIQKDKK